MRHPCRLLRALLISIVMLVLALPDATRAQGTASPQTPAAARIADTLNPADFGARAILVVHYHRPGADYDGWNLWTWPEAQDGVEAAFDGETPFGRYAVVPLAHDARRQGFIVRRGQWDAKDIDHDRFIDLDHDGRTEIWLVAGDQRLHTSPDTIDLSVRIRAAFLDRADTITISTSGMLGPEQRSTLAIARGGGGERGYTIVGVRERRDAAASSGLIYDLVLDRPVAFEDVAALSLAHSDPDEPLTIYARDVLTDSRFTALEAELGSRHGEQSTTFAIWSPVSSRVDLLLYDTHSSPQPARAIAMSHTGRGVWEAEVAGDLHGVAYQYRYFSYGQERTAPDIHCFAATEDSSRSIVVDLGRTNPASWGSAELPQLAQPTDEVIYELHVRDASIADPSAPPELRGTYLGLLHDGTITVDGQSVRTGLGHLQELGITGVHLLPVHDFTARRNEYNWGYWTALFNVPESNYASNPGDPFSAIADLKAAIHGLHSAGIRVILDVVYNHTSSSGRHSAFEQSVPYYYFRTTVDGRLRNDAGVGNSIADERPMVGKYISDSLAFWTTEYRVDGFRFDLLGTHKPESVGSWTRRLRALRPDLTIYGEPWTGGGPTYFPKGAQRGLGLAVFNDHFRNAIRGDLDGTATGFATGAGGDRAAVIRGIMGAIDDFADHPAETINYVSAHDNLTFWDKLLKAQPRADEATRRSMHTLAHAMVLTSQGIAFLHAGSDFARTKGGNHNSYNAGDEVNRLDWARKAEFREVFDYFRGLIELRRAHPAFRMTDRDAVRRAITMLPAGALHGPDVIAYTIDGTIAGDEWATILVAFNGHPKAGAITLPPGQWSQVVDHRSAGVSAIRTVTGRLELPAYSAAVLHRLPQ